ncbi:MAG: two-component system sensor histidine kinase CreC [Verrucomicrobiales bacterium]|nr:two-component system sensor histidine kinase CreC [Verrucomicrobiales bacterium]
MRITLLIIVGFLLIAGGGFFFLMKTISEDVERQYSQASEEPLVDFAHLFASLLEQDVEEGVIRVERFREGFSNAYEREFLARIYRLEKRDIHTHVYVTNEEGIVVFDSERGKREGEDYSDYNDVFLAGQGEYGVRASRTDPDDSRSTVFYVAAPVFHEGELIGTLSVSRPETAMAPFAEESKKLVIRVGILTAVLVFVLGILWAYLILHPIRNITRQALRIAEGEQESLPPSGVGELRSLSLALEEMRRELEGKHYVENYVQALTHELKSPLAAIRGAAELIDESMPGEKRRRFLDNILNETSRSEDMVRRLVQLASVESQSSLSQREEVSLPGILRDELNTFQSVIETKQLVIKQCGFDEDFVVTGDSMMLRIALRNGLNNAFDFSPAGGEVELEFRIRDGLVELTIRDQGPGLPAYAKGRLFDRFYSLRNEATGRKGSGIGLTFVRATVELHGGKASLEDGEEGGAVLKMGFSC